MFYKYFTIISLLLLSSFATAKDSGYVELDPKRWTGEIMSSSEHRSNELYFCNTDKQEYEYECSIIFYYDPTCLNAECTETQNVVREWVQASFPTEYLGGTPESDRPKSDIYVRLPFFYDYANHYNKSMTFDLNHDGYDNPSFDFMQYIHNAYYKVCGLGQYYPSENAHCAEVILDVVKRASKGDYHVNDTPVDYRSDRAEKLFGPFKGYWDRGVIADPYYGARQFHVFGDLGFAAGRSAIQWWDALGSKSGGYPVIVVNTDEIDPKSKGKRTKKKFFNTKGKSKAEIITWLEANKPVVEDI